MTATDIAWMQQAIDLARQAAELGEVPVGALLVKEGKLLATGFNHPIAGSDPCGHAEIHALRNAAQTLGNYRLPGTTLYVTIEPCTMCVGALIHARVERLVFGAREPRAGAVVSHLQILDQTHYNHRVQWSEGVLGEQCSALISEFFRARRRKPGSPAS
ncbi:MAG: hypothetical protein VR73_15820 [Gammaproteobacteria bacterium BRH_c0]|nr:MAG: hypothetical protein VR73_15820 [Gammaproteobacteria bacterium BRH_c0]